jgi:hypothetical protein
MQTFDFRDNAKPAPPPLVRTDSAGLTSVDRQRQDSRRSLRTVPGGDGSPRRGAPLHAFPMDPPFVQSTASSPTASGIWTSSITAGPGSPNRATGRRTTHAPSERDPRPSGKSHAQPSTLDSVPAVIGGPTTAAQAAEQPPRFVRARVAQPERRAAPAPKVDASYRVVPPWHTE